MQKILVSACLMGMPCRYDGTGAENAEVCALTDRYMIVPVCPEKLGGLPAPRPAVEIQDGRAVTEAGEDVTAALVLGAEEAVRMALLLECTYAVMKQNSPSCGCGVIYDGTFTGKKIEGDGLTTRALKANGITVVAEEDAGRLA